MANGIMSSEYTRTYTSFGGCDIVPTFQGKVIGELQAISYSVSREKAPVYTMGSAEPRSFSRGKRGIAGTLVFTVFDRDALVAELEEHAKNSNFRRIGGDELTTGALSVDEWDAKMTSLVGGTADSGYQSADRAQELAAAITPASTIRYADEIPPFDITISFGNEYGQSAVLVLYGVELLNEGSQFSIDHVMAEKACTFVARRIDYLTPVGRAEAGVTSSNTNSTSTANTTSA